MRHKRRLVVAMPLGLLVLATMLLVPSPLPAWCTTQVVGPLVMVLPALLLDRLAATRDGDRSWLRTLAAGVATFPVALVLGSASLLTGWQALHGGSDVVALAGPVLLLVGLVGAVRQRMSGIRLNVLLDGVAGALAGAAVAALVLAPLVHQAWDGTWGAAVLLGRPLLSATLSAAAVGAFGLVGGAHTRQVATWAVGLTTLAAVDIADATRAAAGAHAPLLVSGLLPAAALCLVALGATFEDPEPRTRVPSPRSLAVPTVAAVAAVVALAAAPSWSATAVPSVLALVTLGFCSARFVRVFVQLRELAVIREQALTDELTGIANRRALYQHLDGLLEPGPDGTEEVPEFAVALIDLDHFKEVNDTLGHATGDALLKGVVARFDEALSELQTPYLLARLGGDEFAVVLHEAVSRNAALVVGEALHESLAEPLDLPGMQVHAQASIGLAAVPLHGKTRGEVLFAADAAMYAAKTSGDAVRFHAPKRDEKSQQLSVAEELYGALERRELAVEYQPIRSIDGDLVAVEALVRWDHPERGRLEPAAFLEAAERYRLTGAIAERVLDVALGDLACWRADGVPLTVSVNLAEADLHDEGIVSTVANALLAHRLPAKVLTLDISEAALASDRERVRSTVAALHELGVRLAVDDYGTGGTSLESLMALPLDDLKLDRRFVAETASSPSGAGVVRATALLTHSLGLRMVAEGVEDRRVLQLLAELGCDLVQGRHVGQPMTAGALEAMLAEPTGGKHRLAPERLEPMTLPLLPTVGEQGHRGLSWPTAAPA